MLAQKSNAVFPQTSPCTQQGIFNTLLDPKGCVLPLLLGRDCQIPEDNYHIPSVFSHGENISTSFTIPHTLMEFFFFFLVLLVCKSVAPRNQSHHTGVTWSLGETGLSSTTVKWKERKRKESSSQEL